MFSSLIQNNRRQGKKSQITKAKLCCWASRFRGWMCCWEKAHLSTKSQFWRSKAILGLRCSSRTNWVRPDGRSPTINSTWAGYPSKWNGVVAYCRDPPHRTNSWHWRSKATSVPNNNSQATPPIINAPSQNTNKESQWWVNSWRGFIPSPLLTMTSSTLSSRPMSGQSSSSTMTRRI